MRICGKIRMGKPERGTTPVNPARLINIATQLALSGALQIIDHARQVILRFTGVSPEIRRNLATYILFGNRPE